MVHNRRFVCVSDCIINMSIVPLTCVAYLLPEFASCEWFGITMCAKQRPTARCPRHFDYSAPVWLLPAHLMGDIGLMAQPVDPPDNDHIDKTMEKQEDQFEALREWRKHAKVEPDDVPPISSSSSIKGEGLMKYKEPLGDTFESLEKERVMLVTELIRTKQKLENREGGYKSVEVSSKTDKSDDDNQKPTQPKGVPPAYLRLGGSTKARPATPSGSTEASGPASTRGSGQANVVVTPSGSMEAPAIAKPRPPVAPPPLRLRRFDNLPAPPPPPSSSQRKRPLSQQP